MGKATCCGIATSPCMPTGMIVVRSALTYKWCTISVLFHNTVITPFPALGTVMGMLALYLATAGSMHIHLHLCGSCTGNEESLLCVVCMRMPCCACANAR